MLWVRHETDWKPATRNQRLLAVRLLLSEQAEDGLAGLPRGAVIHGSELPRVDPGLPKTVAGEVFAQWIDPVNLTLLQQRDRTLEMTARYARLHEQTIKHEVTRWHERVNVRGERIALPADGPLEEAAWMKERIARAKQALPNGYCGLPLVQSCPHPNACLTCESFLTDGSCRGMHQQQQGETRRLLEKARKQSNVRLVELLERDEQSLTRILDGLDQIDADHADASGELLDLRDLAQREQDGA